MTLSRWRMTWSFAGAVRVVPIRVALMAAGVGLAGFGPWACLAEDIAPPYDQPGIAAPSLDAAPPPPSTPSPQEAMRSSSKPGDGAGNEHMPKPAGVAPPIGALVPPTVAVLQQYDAARRSIAARDYRRAIELLGAIITTAPGFEPAYADRAVALLTLGENTKAVADLTTALTLLAGASTPALTAPLLANRGGAYLNLKLYDKALADLDQAIAIDPALPFAYTNRGFVYYQLKNYDAAIVDTTRAISLNKRYEFAYTVRGYAYASKKQFALAELDFRSVLAQSPGNQGAILGLRQARLQGKQEDAAKINLVRLADAACEPGCFEWIAIEGKIEVGTAERFKEVLRSAGKKKLPVFVNSGGGSVYDAFEMGRAIRAHGLDVVVTRTAFVTCAKDDKPCRKRIGDDRVLGRPDAAGSACASACGFLIAAGVHRYVGPSGLVGIHQIVSFTTPILQRYQIWRSVRDGRVIETKKIISETKGPTRTVRTGEDTYVKVRKYFTEMGIDQSVMGLLLSAPSSSMHWLTAGELRTTHMMTDPANGEQLIARGTLGTTGGGTTGGGTTGSDGRPVSPTDLQATGGTIGAATRPAPAVVPALVPPPTGPAPAVDGAKVAPAPAPTSAPAPASAPARARTAALHPAEPLGGPAAGQRSPDRNSDGSAITAPEANHACHNRETSCSRALSSCLSNCHERQQGASCTGDCTSAVTYCRDSGIWRTTNCLKTGMAR